MTQEQTSPENPPWSTDLAQLFNVAWAVLLPQEINRRIDARLATLATIGADGAPEARGVVLRAADPARGTVDIFTDAATPKCAEIEADPRVALTLWREDMLVQIRLRGTMEVIEGAPAQEAWRGLPDRALPDYGVTPAPATPIPEALSYLRDPKAARLAILRLTAETLDVVSLQPPVHTRALFERRDGWRGQWRAP
ncbi:pyridoxamine 5'-phosphate oxidase family protein [Celeribacter sp.]|uniref:pyridoxamine 5'-phosphate oxidase family protein n=1 Tax=Celeribacter sp. TaxID=1890673 RepID=UPI003A90DF6C